MIKYILFSVLFLMNLTAHAAVQTDTHTYIVSEKENSVLSINRRTGKEKIFQVGESPRSMVIHGRFGFVTNFRSGDITVINLQRQQVMSTFAVGKRPQQMVTYGNRGYIITQEGISILNLNLNYEIQNGGVYGITLEDPFNYRRNFEPVSMTIYGNLGYVISNTSTLIFVLDLQTNTITKTIDIGKPPVSMVTHGDFAYLTGFSPRDLTIFNLKTETVIKTIPLEMNTPMTIHGDLGYVLSKDITILDLKTNAMIKTIPSRLNGLINMTIHGDFAYLAVSIFNILAIIDLRTDNGSQLIHNIAAPDSVSIHGNYGYVVSTLSPYVNVIDLRTNNLIANFENPNRLNIDFSDTHVYLGVHKSIPLFN